MTGNVRMIKQSLDVKVCRRMLIAVGIGMGLGVIYGLGMFRDEDPVVFWMFLGVTTLFISPVMVLCGWRLWKLYRMPEEYFFTQAKLSTFHQKMWSRGMMYFTVVIDHPEEGTIAVNTNPIFASHGWEQPLLENYMNRTVTVGYNRETGMVVVID